MWGQRPGQAGGFFVSSYPQGAAFSVKPSARRSIFEKYLTKYSHDFRKSTGKLHTICGIIKAQEHKSLRRTSAIHTFAFIGAKGAGERRSPI